MARTGTLEKESYKVHGCFLTENLIYYISMTQN